MLILLKSIFSWTLRNRIVLQLTEKGQINELNCPRVSGCWYPVPELIWSSITVVLQSRSLKEALNTTALFYLELL